MKSGWTVVCLMAALLVSLVAGSAAASSVLNSEEMGALRGGCGWHCRTAWCGTYVGCEADGAYCFPDDPKLDCNNIMRTQQKVGMCDSLVQTLPSCTPGPRTNCGFRWQCRCFYDSPQVYVCYYWDQPLPQDSVYGYVPCL